MRKHETGILYTPRTPQYNKTLVTLTVVLSMFCTIAYSQGIVLDSCRVYEESYRCFVVKKWTADRREFVAVNRKKWWYYIPTFGVSLRSPLAHVNTGVLAEIDHSNVVNAARLASLDLRYQVEFVETIQRIQLEHHKLLIRRDQLERERLALGRLRSIQAIHAEAVVHQTMTPEQRLASQYGYELALSAFQAKESELLLSTLDFFALCRFDLPTMEMLNVADSNCIVIPGHEQKRDSFEVATMPRR